MVSQGSWNVHFGVRRAEVRIPASSLSNRDKPASPKHRCTSVSSQLCEGYVSHVWDVFRKVPFRFEVPLQDGLSMAVVAGSGRTRSTCGRRAAATRA